MSQKQLDTFAREVIDVPVADEMSESFLAYSLSVITARAIPDVRDGLKPVQRRIMHAMNDMGIRPDAPHRKSARVVGETMGKYHPHGDGAIYDTLVRMGQDFARNICLIDPHGNFGSLDDPPAASRYTECRLSTAAMEMIGELEEDTVDFRASYDGENEEPTVLPARIPNLLVNGTTGIAVGMATNMAPHNLAEVAAAITLVLEQRRPKPTVEELMAHLPGPDFPSGGLVIDDGLADAYRTGRGSFRIRARCEIGQVSPRKQGITVTELPYMVGPEAVMKRIQDLRKADKLSGIADVKNLTGRKHGLQLVIECKTGINPRRILAELFKLTPLETSFGINNVALVDGVPTTLGLLDLCQHYIDHRLEVIVRRTEFRLEKARRRLHIVDGLLIALDAIDRVIAIIRGSDDSAQARERLMEELALSEVQAIHILDMQLRRLTALERIKLEEEHAHLTTDISGYEQLLGSERRQRTLVKTELAELVGVHGSERRTVMVDIDDLDDETPQPELAAGEATDIEISDDPCVITLSTSGLLGREGLDQQRGTFGRHDVLVSQVLTSNHQAIHAITSAGRTLSMTAMEAPEVAGRSRGGQVKDLFSLARGEEVLGLFSPSPPRPSAAEATAGHPGGESEPDAQQSLVGTAANDAGSDSTAKIVLVTRSGIVKRLDPIELANTKSDTEIIRLKESDQLVAAFEAGEDDEVLLVASDGQVLRTPSSGISVQGRSAGGVAGMKLKGDAKVSAAGRARPDTLVLTVTDLGLAKVTEGEEFPSKGRGTGGVRSTKLGDAKSLSLAHVGSMGDITVIVGRNDEPNKSDPAPQPLSVQPTRRDLASTATHTPILGAGSARW